MAAMTSSIAPSASCPSTSIVHHRPRVATVGGSMCCLSSPSRTPQTTAILLEDLKKLAAIKAVEYVKSDMVLGLGTGVTAGFFVAEIGALLSSGRLSGIVGVPTSKRTFELAKTAGIPLSTLDEHPRIDLAIDGADEACFLIC